MNSLIRQHALLYILLLFLVATIGVLSAEILSGRSGIAYAAGEDLTVNLFDENGDPLQFAQVFVFDADNSAGDALANGSPGASGSVHSTGWPAN